jgi:hypothetical protein
MLRCRGRAAHSGEDHAFGINAIREIARKIEALESITDYSRKETDTFGTTSLLQRSYAKRSQQRIVMDTDDLRRVQALLSGLRATPAAWIGDDDTARFAPLAIFGWFRSFSIDIPGPVTSYCTLEIEGLT